ncbi:hypothetical protein BJ138DRAFT_1158546 [Hygrophoropsis aurantiaca]|uniref:Uncharacterized protein n=1 Tax=Hygrophoropsis aurantiaca TaxID=72124 RepID=A0ACB8A3R4_9AGAM|nr:hypothetical protein BJ138DRAFT_1158546 [Hygrophoropsis aurantiaca]
MSVCFACLSGLCIQKIFLLHPGFAVYFPFSRVLCRPFVIPYRLLIVASLFDNLPYLAHSLSLFGTDEVLGCEEKCCAIYPVFTVSVAFVCFYLKYIFKV